MHKIWIIAKPRGCLERSNRHIKPKHVKFSFSAVVGPITTTLAKTENPYQSKSLLYERCYMPVSDLEIVDAW
jgi:hypothetical protein